MKSLLFCVLTVVYISEVDSVNSYELYTFRTANDDAITKQALGYSGHHKAVEEEDDPGTPGNGIRTLEHEMWTAGFSCS